MTEPSSNQPAPAPRLAVTSWALAQLTADYSRRRGLSVILVAAAVAIIGWVDYSSGFWFSLTLFYLIPITLSIVRLGWRAGCVTAVASIVVRMTGDWADGIYHTIPPVVVSLNRLFDLSVYLLFIWAIHSFVSLRRQLEQRVRQRTAALEEVIGVRNLLQTQLFDISRRERSAIGHELHDGLGQHLTATMIATNLLAQRLAQGGEGQPAHDARSIVKMLQDGIAKTRQIARGLLLAAIEPEQLVGELDEMIATLRREQGLAGRFIHSGKIAEVVDVATASHLFYIAQEAVRNAVRHARPTRIDINLVANPEALELTITDNGRGLPPSDARTGMGLRIMAHRTEVIGGRLLLESTDPGGTIVRCHVPLPARPVMPS